jgi:hypothetical protein
MMLAKQSRKKPRSAFDALRTPISFFIRARSTRTYRLNQWNRFGIAGTASRRTSFEYVSSSMSCH